MPILEVRNLQKIYSTRLGGNQVTALRDVSFAVEKLLGGATSGSVT